MSGSGRRLAAGDRSWKQRAHDCASGLEWQGRTALEAILDSDYDSAIGALDDLQTDVEFLLEAVERLKGGAK
jgi:hypothetical protein